MCNELYQVNCIKPEEFRMFANCLECLCFVSCVLQREDTFDVNKFKEANVMKNNTQVSFGESMPAYL